MRSMSQPHTCPLCSSVHSQPYFSDKHRDYQQCPSCYLVFVPACQHLNAAQEKAIYDQHENSLADQGYRQFLSRLAEPLSQRLHTNSKGLDFGCGFAPLLANMLQQQGHSVALYDLYYYPDSGVLQQQYDFITSSEVIEHLSQPAKVLAQWKKMLKPRATLALMTKLVINQERFASWHYKNDLTHIAFYSRETFEFIANHYAMKVEFIANDVIFLTNETP